MDMHWAPITEFCTPCQIHFDIIINFETLQVRASNCKYNKVVYPLHIIFSNSIILFLHFISAYRANIWFNCIFL